MSRHNAKTPGNGRQKYIRAVGGYLASGAALTDQAALAAYAATLSKSRRGHLKSAVKKWTEAMATAVKGQAMPDNMAAIQATLLRFEALQEATQVAPQKGQKAHTWLSALGSMCRRWAAPGRGGGHHGLVLRSLGWGNRLGKGLTAVSLFRIVAKYGKLTIREYLYCQRP